MVTARLLLYICAFILNISLFLLMLDLRTSISTPSTERPQQMHFLFHLNKTRICPSYISAIPHLSNVEVDTDYQHLFDNEFFVIYLEQRLEQFNLF